MIHLLPAANSILKTLFSRLIHQVRVLFRARKARYKLASVINILLMTLILTLGRPPAERLINPLVTQLAPLSPLTETKNSKEVFGFAPYWNINKLANIDFKILTTLAYFGVEVDGNGNLVKDDPGYQTFRSSEATSLFKKAHAGGTRVVLTLTQMRNNPILALMDSDEAQSNLIEESVNLVKQRGIDGINVDLEFAGDPGDYYRARFSQFVGNLTNRMHREVPGSHVTISVYASAVKDPKIYDIAALGRVSDGIFMMAYDFAVASSDNAIPTAPLNGHENGAYWYDIATAVDDFLKFMPSEKLILGVPYYGYNYLVYEPTVKAETRPSYSWRGRPASQTYTVVQDKFNSSSEAVRGWDDNGKVGYIAYYVPETDTWRMIFMEDTRSLGIKYDFAKEKSLGGVGIWALGNDEGKRELWNLLKEKFGSKKVANKGLLMKAVKDVHE